jgi:hypothetical protein
VWLDEKFVQRKAYSLVPTGRKKQMQFKKKFCVRFSSQEHTTLPFSRIINFNNFYVKHHH